MKSAASGVTGRPESSKGQLRVLAAAIAAAVTVCLAGYWEFEQVDSGSLGSYVAIDKASDGTIWLAYVNRDSAIRLAHKDTIWGYEDLDTTLVRPDFQSWPPIAFDIGPGDRIGVVGLGRLAEHRDSGWSSEELPMPMSGFSLSFDSASRPSLTFVDSLGTGCFGLRTDSSWDTEVVFIPTWGIPTEFSLTRPSWRRNGNCASMVTQVYLGGIIDFYDFIICERDSGVWDTAGVVGGGLDGYGRGFAALADSSDSIHTFWSAADPYGADALVCDAVHLDGYTAIGAACLDDSGRVQCAWVRDDVLKFALLHEPTLIVGSGGGIVWCDITTDTLSQPVIAYCTSDGSIYVAYGIDVAGISSESRRPAVRILPHATSIVRSVLFLPRDMTGLPGNSDRVPRPTLLDAAGRKVLALHAGANDVSHLAPGVYFVRLASGVKLDASSATKVVIQH